MGEVGGEKREGGTKCKAELNSGNILWPLCKGVTSEETEEKKKKANTTQSKTNCKLRKELFFFPKFKNKQPSPQSALKIIKKIIIIKSPEVTERKPRAQRLSLSPCTGQQPTFRYIRVFFHLTPSFSHITAQKAILYLGIAALRPIP